MNNYEPRIGYIIYQTLTDTLKQLPFIGNRDSLEKKVESNIAQVSNILDIDNRGFAKRSIKNSAKDILYGAISGVYDGLKTMVFFRSYQKKAKKSLNHERSCAEFCGQVIGYLSSLGLQTYVITSLVINSDGDTKYLAPAVYLSTNAISLFIEKAIDTRSRLRHTQD